MTIPEDPTPEQVQSLVDACPQADLFAGWTPLDGYYELRIITFYEQAIKVLWP